MFKYHDAEQPAFAVSAPVHAAETTRLSAVYAADGHAEGDLMGPGVSWHRHTPTVSTKRIFLTFL